MTTFIHDGRVLGVRAITHSARNPATVVGAIVSPALFFALFNLIMARVMEARGFDYRQILPPTIVVQAMFFTAMSSAYYVADDRRSGVIARLRSLPINRAALLVGRSTGDLARAAASVAVITALGLATGMRFERGWPWLIVFVGIALLFSVAMSLGMGLIGYLAPTPESAASLASTPYLPLLMLSSGFAPVEDFPGWLEPIVRLQPVTATIETLRATTGHGDLSATLPVCLGWLIGATVLFAVAGGRALERTT